MNSTATNPNLAVYAEENPYAGPLPLKAGTVTSSGQPIVALHHNGDGSYSGVTEHGGIVKL